MPMFQMMRYFSSGSSKDTIYSPGKFEDHYNKGPEIGRGHFATVYEARAHDGRRFNVKEVHTKSMRDTTKKKVRSEVAILHRLSHPSVMSLEEVFANKETTCIVTSPLNGGDLLSHITKHGALSEAQAKIVMKSLFSAVEHCHENGVMHRDIKPENVVLNESESLDVTLCDFGMATYFHETDSDESEEKCRKAHHICGTIEYLAPEMVEVAKARDKTRGYGPSIDMWSLGVLMYTILSGRRPFEKRSYCMGTRQSDIDVLLPVFKDKQTCDLAHRILVGDYDPPGPEVQDEYTEHGLVRRRSDHKVTLTEDALSLLEQLLTVDPEKRLTASEALEHPWLNSQRRSSVSSVSTSATDDQPTSPTSPPSRQSSHGSFWKHWKTKKAHNSVGKPENTSRTHRRRFFSRKQ